MRIARSQLRYLILKTLHECIRTPSVIEEAYQSLEGPIDISSKTWLGHVDASMSKSKQLERYGVVSVPESLDPKIATWSRMRQGFKRDFKIDIADDDAIEKFTRRWGDKNISGIRALTMPMPLMTFSIVSRRGPSIHITVLKDRKQSELYRHIPQWQAERWFSKNPKQYSIVVNITPPTEGSAKGILPYSFRQSADFYRDVSLSGRGNEIQPYGGNPATDPKSMVGAGVRPLGGASTWASAWFNNVRFDSEEKAIKAAKEVRKLFKREFKQYNQRVKEDEEFAVMQLPTGEDIVLATWDDIIGDSYPDPDLTNSSLFSVSGGAGVSDESDEDDAIGDVVDTADYSALEDREQRLARPTDEELDSLFDEYGTWAAVGDRLGVHATTARKWAREAGIQKRGQRGSVALASPTKEELESLFDKHGSWRAVAKDIGHHRVTVQKWAHEAGIQKRGRPGPSTLARPSKEVLEALYDEHGSWRAVGKHLGVTGGTAAKWAREAGIQKRGRYSVALTSPAKEELESLFDEHRSWAAVARHLGYTRHTVQKWAHEAGIQKKGQGGPPRKARPTKEELDSLFDEHGSWKAVGRHLGIMGATALGWAREAGIQKLGPRGRFRRNPNRPTDEELESLFDEHGSWAAVARHLGVEKSMPAKWAREAGIQKSGKSGRIAQARPTKEEMNALFDEYGSWRAVGKHLGVHATTVRKWAREA